MAMEEATTTETEALASLPFSLGLELSDRLLSLKAFVLEQSVVELMMTKPFL